MRTRKPKRVTTSALLAECPVLKRALRDSSDGIESLLILGAELAIDRESNGGNRRTPHGDHAERILLAAIALKREKIAECGRDPVWKGAAEYHQRDIDFWQRLIDGRMSVDDYAREMRESGERHGLSVLDGDIEAMRARARIGR